MQSALGDGQDPVAVRLHDVWFVDSDLLHVGGREVLSGHGSGSLTRSGCGQGVVGCERSFLEGEDGSPVVATAGQAVRADPLECLGLDVRQEGVARIEFLEGRGEQTGNQTTGGRRTGGSTDRTPGRGGGSIVRGGAGTRDQREGEHCGEHPAGAVAAGAIGMILACHRSGLLIRPVRRTSDTP